MSCLRFGAAIAAVVVSCAPLTSAGLTDFMITDASGNMYTVDGNTLATTFVAKIQNGSLLNEIVYAGNNQYYYTAGQDIGIINIATGVKSVVVNVSSGFDENISYITGMTRTSNNELFMGVKTYSQNGNPTYQTSYNMDTGAFDQSFFVGYGVVSFIELEGELFALTKEGAFYNFDYADGSSTYYGTITGAGTSLIGTAVIPAPSSFALLAIAGIASSRRRR